MKGMLSIMIINTGVRGTQKEIPELEINVDTVYIRENIHQITEDEKTFWEYDEKQLSILEYLKDIVPKNQEISDNALAELCNLFVAYQEQIDNAIAEISILLAGGNE